MAEWLMALVLPAIGGSASGGKTRIMWKVYVLKSLTNGRLYTGYSESLEDRIMLHNSGKVRSTKAYKPYALVYQEEFSDKTEARKRELFLKSGKGREFLRSFL